MIDEPRLDAYRRIVEEETVRNDDIDDIARQIEELQRERRLRRQQQGQQQQGRINMDAQLESQLDYGSALESDPFAGLSEQELAELELAPHEINFTDLSQEQQVRYWSLLSPGEKLTLVRLHLQVDREEIAHRLQLPSKILRHLEEDRFAQLPSASAVRHYYHLYADELGIEPEQLIRQYEVLTGQVAEYSDQGKKHFLTSLKHWQPKFIWLTVAAFIAGVLLIGFAVQSSRVVPENDREAVTSGLQGSEVQTASMSAKTSTVTEAVDQMDETGVTYGARQLVENKTSNSPVSPPFAPVQP